MSDVFTRIGDSTSAQRYGNLAQQIEEQDAKNVQNAKPNFLTAVPMSGASGNPDGSTRLFMGSIDSTSGKVVDVGEVANKNVGPPVAMNMNGKNVMVNRSEYGDNTIIPGAAPVQQNQGNPFLGQDAFGNKVTFLPQNIGPPISAPGVTLPDRPNAAEASARATALLGKINIPPGVDINGAQLSTLIANSDLTPEEKQFLVGYTTLHPTTPSKFKVVKGEDNQLYKFDPRTGALFPTGVGGNTLRVPPSMVKAFNEAAQTEANVDSALAELKKHPSGVGLASMMPDAALQRLDPDGVALRAAIVNVSSQVLHDLSGAAVTVGEYERTKPYIPKVTDPPAAVRIKLMKIRQIAAQMKAKIQGQYPINKGWQPLSTGESGGGGLSFDQFKKLLGGHTN